MEPRSPGLVDVFPISTTAFGLRADWYETFAPRFIQPTYFLMALLLIVSIGIMALKRFEHSEFEKKAWGLPVIISVVVFWPALVVGLKDLVDSFDTFLINEVFRISWKGFGFPDPTSTFNVFGWSAEGLARFLPNLAYWTIYAFYIIFFFFYAALGPMILAKGILTDEIEAFLELIKELMVLLLWQTTLVILVCLIMPDIVSGQPLPPHPRANFYFLSLILGIMIFFVPSLTRKFGNHLGTSFVPMGFKWGGAAIGASLFGAAGASLFSAAGLPMKLGHRFEKWKEHLERAEEFQQRYHHSSHIQELDYEKRELERKDYEREAEELHHRNSEQRPEHAADGHSKFDLFKQAKREAGLH